LTFRIRLTVPSPRSIAGLNVPARPVATVSRCANGSAEAASLSSEIADVAPTARPAARTAARNVTEILLTRTDARARRFRRCKSFNTLSPFEDDFRRAD